MPCNRDIGRSNGMEVIPKQTTLWLGFWLRFEVFVFYPLKQNLKNTELSVE